MLKEKYMFCANCGTRLLEDARFCSKCGLTINETIISDNNRSDKHDIKTAIFFQAKCDNCGAHLTVDKYNNQAFCPSCGTPYLFQNDDRSNNHKLSDFKVVGGELVCCFSCS